MLGKLSVPGRPTSLDDSRARAYCPCSRRGWGLFGHFFSHLSFLFSFSLSLGDDPIKTKILSQRVVKSKTTNQPIFSFNKLLIDTKKCDLYFLFHKISYKFVYKFCEI